MAVAKPPRQYHHNLVHFMRKSISYADGTASESTVGVIPAGSVIMKAISGVYVTTAFNSGGANTLDIGTNGGDTGADDDADAFGTALALGTANFVPLDVTTGEYLVNFDTNITCTLTMTGTAATAGAAEVVVAYVPDNDG